MVTKPKDVKAARVRASAPAPKPVKAKPIGLSPEDRLHVDAIRAKKAAEKQKASAEKKERNKAARAATQAAWEAAKKAKAEAKKVKTPEQVAKEAKAAATKAAKEGKALVVTEANKQLVPIAKEINVRFEKAAKLEHDADDHRLAAALQLEAARKLCDTSGIKFKTWAEKNVPQSFETVRKLVAIGASDNPQKALEDMRNKNAAANKTLRTKQKASRAAPAASEEGDGEDSGTEPGTTQTKSRTVHVLEGAAAMRLAFSALSATDKMEFANWVALEIGAKLDMTF